MVGILLKYLKLASAISVDEYIYCMPSESLPGYHYFIHEKELNDFAKECGNLDVIEMLRKDANKCLFLFIGLCYIERF